MIATIDTPHQQHIDWLIKSGVPVRAMYHPRCVLLAQGERAKNGTFQALENGVFWFVFEESEDVVFWQPRIGQLATHEGRAFALGEDAINNPATYSYDGHLNIFSDPLDWLRAKRDGIVVLDWTRAFDRLRDCPRISVDEKALTLYKRHMHPPQLPDLYVQTDWRAAA
ncbi:hypothetical protein [Mesorhizobium jarvisii]|uniref:hypothetical protein n=1 Tax=Mesorhizobium jarvisii TaxID=1777867 RepID=UPI001F0AA56D|nr:hypothetical protein [Mesorhizobium jarvisii]MCH4554852.1 hypothetical protein [Mesorhizobium jarvisii]